MRQSFVALAACAAVLAAGATVAAPGQHDPAIHAAVGAATRTPGNVARDRYRHPVETLTFFGVKPGDTVVEIWPGGGWYTEILAPLTKDGGKLWAVAPWPNGVERVKGVIAKDAATYGHVQLAAFPWSEGQPKVPDGSADVVLTFRNVHNWRMGDNAPLAFSQMFAMLKPGGTLGIVDHRLPEAASEEREKSSGYIKTATVKKLAADAGFELVAESEINANPKDTADWTNGVWTLPPTLSQKEADRDKYLAIGESDRMTLRFRKPG